MHYRWHPEFGRSIPIIYREHRRGTEVAVCESGATRLVIPAWMFDAGACALMTVGPHCAAISSMLALRTQLSALGFDRSTCQIGREERSDESVTTTAVTTGDVEQRTSYGFRDIVVIDDDLGISASGTHARPGFESLVRQICEGTVGAVLCLEASRLARNGRDWHHLIELCGLVGARVFDADGV